MGYNIKVKSWVMSLVLLYDNQYNKLGYYGLFIRY